MIRNLAMFASIYAALGTPVAVAAEAIATFQVDGMTCASCRHIVKTAMSRVDGVNHVSVSFENRQAVVSFDAEVTTPGKIAHASNEYGFPALQIAKPQ